jgi:hypothetical protein
MTAELPASNSMSGFDDEIDVFAKHIESIKNALPVMVSAAGSVTSDFRKDLKKFEDENCEVAENDDERTVRVPYDSLAQWKKLTKRFENFALASKLLPRSLVVTLVSQYDAYLGRLLRCIFLAKPEVLNSSERKLSFQEISDLGSVEAAREYVLEKEVEAILRSSHADQFKWLENAFKLPLNKGLDCWPTFIELTERRNLFVHTDGVVSSQYISVCQKHGVKLDPNLKEGEQLWVSQSYFRNATACIYEIGIKLGHVLWRKLLPDEREAADGSFINLTYELLVNEEYNMAKLLLDFAFKDFTNFSNEVRKLSLLVNRAQAYKWSGDSVKCAEIMGSVDWPARSELLRLANSVLTEQWDDSAKLMRKMGAASEIRSTDYRDWPLFKEFREQPQFRQAFKDVFGDAFIVETGVDAEPENDGNENGL